MNATRSASAKMESRPTVETVKVLNLPSARVSYRRTGTGPAVLLIQGAGTVGETWRPQIDGLSSRYTTISFDNRGIGGSTILSERLTIEAMALDAIAIMNAERLERFHVVGHSMGGLIAQEIALRVPARVKSLALLCSFARGRQGVRMTPAMILTGLRTRIGTRKMRREAFLGLVMPPAVLAARDPVQLAEELRPLFGRDLAEQPPIVLKQVSAMARYDSSSRLGDLAGTPTLVVSAMLDRISLPRFGREIAALIPGARLVEIPDAGHGVPLHSSAQINALLIEHLSGAEIPSVG